MDKKLWAFCLINVLALSCGAIFLWLAYNPEPFLDLGISKVQTAENSTVAELGFRHAREIKIILGAGVLLLSGLLLWGINRKVHADHRANRLAEEKDPTSLRDWAIALLIFPGCIILPIVIGVFFGFSDAW